ncbi:MAG: sugar phosphate isomerase/epimerase family protein [Planctomycetota bacterium]
MTESTIAAQLYTARELLTNPADIADTFKKLRQIGFEAVQVSGIKKEAISDAELKKIADGEGLDIIATHCGYDALVNDIDAIIEQHKTLGCSMTACAALPGDKRSAEGYAQAARDLTEAGKKLAAEDIILGYHNHAFEFQKYDGRLGIEILYEDSDPGALVAEIDTYWVQFGGGSPVAWINKLSDRLPFVHFKDMTIVDNKPVFAEIGEGNLDWPAIIEACRNAGTRWYIIEQDTCPGNPLESLKKSFDNMKAMGLK